MLKIKWTERITNYEDFQKAKEGRLIFKIFQNRRLSWIGHTVRHNEFVVKIFQGAISVETSSGKTLTAVLTASCEKYSS
jgi:hypothetical protein